MTLYTDRKPREAVAIALAEADSGPLGSKLFQIHWQEFSKGYRASAAIALNTLRELGFITSEGLDAIHAEEDANGEPRSSVVPGTGR